MKSFLMEDKKLPIYVVNIMGADDLVTQGSRASATMILFLLNQDNLVPTY